MNDNNKRGSALLYVIFTMLLLSVIGIGLLHISLEDRLISRRSYYDTKAYYMSDYKLQLVLNSDRYYNDVKNKIEDFISEGFINSRVYLDKEDLIDKELDNIVFLYNEEDPLIYSIISKGKYNKSTRSIKAIFNPFIEYNKIYENKVLSNNVNFPVDDKVLIDYEISYKFSYDVYEKFKREGLLIDSRVIEPKSNLEENVYVEGNLFIDGTLGSETVVNGLVYVKGNLYTSNYVTVNGILIVDGNIEVLSDNNRDMKVNGILIYNCQNEKSNSVSNIDIKYNLDYINKYKVIANSKTLRDKPAILLIRELRN